MDLSPILGSERESVKCPIWRGLERLRPAAGCRLARQPLFSEPQIQRWRPVWWGRTFYARSRNWKESSHLIDSSWVGSPARLIAGTLGGTGRPSLASQSTRTKPFKPEPNERTSLYSFLCRAQNRFLTSGGRNECHGKSLGSREQSRCAGHWPMD